MNHVGYGSSCLESENIFPTFSFFCFQVGGDKGNEIGSIGWSMKSWKKICVGYWQINEIRLITNLYEDGIILV